MNIDDEIKNLIDKLKTEYKIPAYAYNNNEKFIAGTTPIYYSSPYFDDREVLASIKTLLIGKWMSAGENVLEFEKLFSKKTNNLFSCMVNSGSSANLIMIAALKKYFKWEDNSEIIVSVVGFPTTISVLPQNNLIPIFIDIEFDTLNFDLNLIENKITNKTKAIFVSPVLGNPPNMDKIIEICDKYNLKLILDNCDSLGSKWKNKFLNEYAIASSCSFYAAHDICTFEGGMISSDNKELMNIVHSLINWGRACVCSGSCNLLPNGICNNRFDKWLDGYDEIVDHKYVFNNLGYNLKPIDMCGAVGVVQINKLDEICYKRKYAKNIITKLFSDNIDNIKIPKQLKDSDTVWFGSPIICENKNQKHKLVAYLEKNKIQTRNYFAGNILLHSAFKKFGNYKEYPNAMTVLDKVFFIGASPSYTPEIFAYIEDVIRNFKNE
jgi:CDP-6-deoxy-D-xylo-4-hexulose-3-dehydrase